MRKFYFRALLLTLPLVLWTALEVFILPVDFFAFRHWEAVGVRHMYSLPGPFYPHTNFKKWSAPDMNPSGPRDKLIEFVTDAYGYRNRSYDTHLTYDYVILGDSNVGGAYLDQKDTLPEVMARLCNCNTYNYGNGSPHHIMSYVNEERFRQTPPKTVVLEVRPSEFLYSNIPDISQCVRDHASTSLRTMTCREDSISLYEKWFENNPQILIYLDRFFKHSGFQKLKSSLGLAKKVPPPAVIAEMSKEAQNEMRRRLLIIQKTLLERGSRFILFVMPTEDRQFDDFLRTVQSDGIPVVFFFPTKDYPQGQDLKTWWCKEDSHWTEESVIIAAKAIHNESTHLPRITKNNSTY